MLRRESGATALAWLQFWGAGGSRLWYQGGTRVVPGQCRVEGTADRSSHYCECLYNRNLEPPGLRLPGSSAVPAENVEQPDLLKLAALRKRNQRLPAVLV